ncbi:MAG TPA: PQQ-binding-like beta-propeller repeat protein [Gammaproteobacteria bacterium]|nr:PQQ-binding-like beta-propeller repeat protein [Gammaproteobacteria bacterium]
MQRTRTSPEFVIRAACAATLLALAAGCSDAPDEADGAAAESAGAADPAPAAQPAAAASPSAAAPDTDGSGAYTTWRTYSGGSHASQYSALDQINQSNVADLEVAWTYPAEGGGVFNPIVVDDVMYVLAGGQIVSLDATTGAELWTNDPDGVSGRGINYWESDDGTDRRLVFHGGGFIKAINAETGETITSFGDNGRVDLRQALDGGRDISNVRPLGTSNPGRVFEDLMIVSLPAQGAGYTSTPGNVGAWNILTGELEWVFHAIPHPGEFGYDTWPEGAYLTAGGIHNWSELTVDSGNGIAFVPFGSPRYDFFGGDREGDNLYGNSLVAIDARTGERLWHQQLVRHDLWDFDLPQAPKLLNLTVDGRQIEAVAQATKQGFLFVFDRLTGEPVWPIEERPVPQSDLPGEHTSPTQPYPTVLEPFAVLSFTADDINPLLAPEDRERVAELLAGSRNEGLFTPPSFEGSISMPGHNGGANWGGSAVDPIGGSLYVISKNLPVMLRAHVAADDAEPSAGGGGGGGTPTVEEIAASRAEAEASLADGAIRYEVPYEFLRDQATGLSVVAPPWSHLTAYDLNTGEIKWRIPNGRTPIPGAPEDSGSHMPRGAPLATAGGLLFVATAQDRRLRAYDRESGAVLWEYELPRGSEGIPATYEVAGRQYLAVNVTTGNGLFAPEGLPELTGEPAYMVFALPAN